MDTSPKLDPASPRISRYCLLCGAGSLAVAGALGSIRLPALAETQAQERAIGLQVYNDLRKQNQIIDQSVYYPVLRAVGQRISTAAQPHWWPMTFVIVKGDKANAFSVPGGWLYVNETLLKNAENEEELASVVGHETGHIVLGHVMNRIHQAQTANIVGGILGLFIRNQLTATVLNLAGNYAFLNFSRQQEYQADHEGVILASKANYNPWGMIWFFNRLQKLYGDVGFEQYVQDHPSTKDRIARIEGYFKSNPTAYARWSPQITASNGLRVSGAADRLILN
ncbi:MAG TPA: M48 family metalloprotease [Candidatus Tumulicola sp.]|nr:M48 family metalloprotease [Candidatus Tumulicola sp.]